MAAINIAPVSDQRLHRSASRRRRFMKKEGGDRKATATNVG
jgi:hypothetical protein